MSAIPAAFALVFLFLAGGAFWALRLCTKRGFFGGENARIGIISKDKSPAWYGVYVIFFLALIALALAASTTFFFLALGS